MRNHLPGHLLPNYSESVRNDTLFHYTTAQGLIGIFDSQEIWGTAYYCANDEEELSAGHLVLKQAVRERAFQLKKANDARAVLFARRGANIMDYAEGFEDRVVAFAKDALTAYISCFHKPSAAEDFHHGLLSQWRGYGVDGGYALQFSRSKLEAALESANREDKLDYSLNDVHYSTNSPLAKTVLDHKDAFLSEFERHLDELARPIQDILSSSKFINPLSKLINGPLESLLNYLIFTKSSHFSEERECRLTIIQPNIAHPTYRPVKRYSRGGLIVPYVTTPPSFNILDAVEWILVGPAPRIEARIKSVSELVKYSGKNIAVRPSHIPFTRS